MGFCTASYREFLPLCVIFSPRLAVHRQNFSNFFFFFLTGKLERRRRLATKRDPSGQKKKTFARWKDSVPGQSPDARRLVVAVRTLLTLPYDELTDARPIIALLRST